MKFRTAILALLLSACAFAGEPSLTTPAVSTVNTRGGNWEITIGGYAWAAGMEGDVGAAGFTAPVDLSFSDIFDTLDSTATGLIDARNGPWMFQLEGLYLKNSVGISATTPGGATVAAGLTSETTRLCPLAGYRIFGDDATGIDLLAGAVYYDISNEFSITTPLGGISPESGDEWIDPIVGIRIDHAFHPDWHLIVRGDIGGFGAASDLVWQASALVSYRISDSWSAYFGYRHAAVDYTKGGFTYDAAASGPVLGIACHW